MLFAIFKERIMSKGNPASGNFPQDGHKLLKEIFLKIRKNPALLKAGFDWIYESLYFSDTYSPSIPSGVPSK